MGAIVPGKSGAGARTCRRVRDRLCAGEAREALHEETRQHLDSCAACAAFARRLGLVRQALGGPLGSWPEAPGAPLPIQPDPGFPARVVARIERPAELLGWAAFRALPAALGLALALAWLGFTSQSAPAVTATTASPQVAMLDEGSPSADQLIAWSAGPPEIWP